MLKSKISCMDELFNALEKNAAKALKMTQNEVYSVFEKHITEYYEDSMVKSGINATPLLSERLYNFLNSLIKTDIGVSGNTISCTVEINPHYNDDSAIKKDEVWSAALEELGYEQGIITLMKKNLKKSGVPVK